MDTFHKYIFIYYSLTLKRRACSYTITLTLLLAQCMEMRSFSR